MESPSDMYRRYIDRMSHGTFPLPVVAFATEISPLGTDMAASIFHRWERPYDGDK
jgi:hypothetical protein